ncbi:MAG: hypothetical protein GC149_11700 [Gammaproteobacteria bacterium]|nr:hypothetical protein [Gammaproteobacteria bacterium]
MHQTDAIKKSSPDGRFAIGVAGRVTANTLQCAVHLTGNEIDLISSEPGGFLAQAFGLIYREVYRSFETYLVELFGEIARRDKRILFSNHQITHEDALKHDSPETLQSFVLERRKAKLTRIGLSGLESTFENIGLPLVPMVEPPSVSEQQSVLLRLQTASAIRNVIEHNSGIINEEFLKLIPGTSYKLGEHIIISTPELGDAISAIEWASDNLNRRAVEKYKI